MSIKENMIYKKLQPYFLWLGLGLGMVGLIVLDKKKPIRKKRRRKATGTTTGSRTISSGASRIRTKSGKLITGKANVLAYKKRLSNLAKARRKKR